MASPEELEKQDAQALAAHFQMFGKEATAQFAADLYKLKRAEKAAAPSTFGGFPRWAVAALAVWLALLETADKLPRLLLAYPGYEATLAEFHAKMMQPDLVQAQLDKARLEAKAASFQPALTAAQAYKAEVDAVAAGSSTTGSSYKRLSYIFDLLDPNHPSLISSGDLMPEIEPLLIEIVKAQEKRQTSPRPASGSAPTPTATPTDK